jgi:hypothetical protein
MDENNEPQAPPDDDRTPTQQDEEAAKEKPAGGWAMPEPVFRSSSGHLPKAFEERVRQSQGQAAETAAEVPTAEVPAAIPEDDESALVDPLPDPPVGAAIAAQPDMDALEEQPAAPAEVLPMKPKKRGFFKVLLLVLGLILAFALIGAIVTGGVIYYFYQTSESQSLN